MYGANYFFSLRHHLRLFIFFLYVTTYGALTTSQTPGSGRVPCPAVWAVGDRHRRMMVAAAAASVTQPTFDGKVCSTD